jgi:hypothetical protein
MAHSATNRLISRAFLTAHLLTGNAAQAERVTLKAIGSWNPEEESEELLFQNVFDAAVRLPVKLKPEAASAYLPAELNAVLCLAPELRCCFVLRVLMRLPSQVCARLLDLHSDTVDNYTCAALRCLGTAASRLHISVANAA